MSRTIKKICLQCLIEFNGRWQDHQNGGANFCSRKCFFAYPRPSYPKEPPIDRFYRGFIMPNNKNACWEWIKGLSKGYGRMFLNKKEMKAHRFSYLHFIGEIPENNVVAHRCDNPKCVNPQHLFVGTVQDNVLDKFKKGRAIIARGENQGGSKLKTEDILKIRKMKKIKSTWQNTSVPL